MSTTRRSSDCPRCLKRVKLVGSRGVMPRHLDPETRETCASSGLRPTDVATQMREDAKRAAAAVAVNVTDAPCPGCPTCEPEDDIHDQHGCEGCSVCEPWTETHEISSIRAELLACASDPGDGFGHQSPDIGERLLALAVRLGAMLPAPPIDAATEIDDAIDLGHSN
jgi:hypothetical protein